MDSLAEILNGLSPEEITELEKYLSSMNISRDRKDRQLLRILHKNPESEVDDIVQQLYKPDRKGTLPNNARNAYAQWKYLLNKHLEEFCVHRISQEDTSGNILKSIMVARFLFNHKRYGLAYKYLQKAEQSALSEQRFEMLQQVYSLQIEYIWTNPRIDIQALKEKWKQNALLLQKNAALNVSLNLIRQQLGEAHAAGETIDIDNLTAPILEEYGIDEEIKKNPDMLFKLAMIVQAALEEKKDFPALAEYLVKTFQHLETTQLFDKHNHRLKIELLTSICRAYIKYKQYERCEHYLNVLKHEHTLYPEYILLNLPSLMIEYVLLISTNRLKQAEQHITGIESSYLSRLTEEDTYFFWTLNCNLISCNSYSGNWQGAKKYMARLLYNEKGIKNYGGLKGLVCTHFVDCMIHMDSGTGTDYALSKLRAMQKRFSQFLERPENVRYKTYMKILRELARSSDIGHPRIQEDVAFFLAMDRPVIGSWEFVPFSSWLLAKVQKRDFYEVDVEMAN